MKGLRILVWGAVFICTSGFTVEGFRRPMLPQSAFSEPYDSYLHFGSHQKNFQVRGHFGVDFSIIRVRLNERMAYEFGMVGLAHINMQPNGIKFSVDNFHAAFGLFFGGQYTERFHWRFYPIYHLSAHLADGHDGSKINGDLRAISNEQVRFEFIYLPVEQLQLGISYGAYFHSIQRKQLQGVLHVNVLFTLFPKRRATPFIWLSNELLNEAGWAYGFDLLIGARFVAKNKRGMSLAGRVYNLVHPGYYYRDQRSPCGGVELRFHL